MTDRDARERDILVAPNEYVYVQDLTKGHIALYVGPTKVSLSNTERMILFCDGRFVPVRPDEPGLGVLPFVEATSSQYVVLENPTEADDLSPERGANHSVPLRLGRKVVVPGPASFPLWPGQTARVVDGHRLRQDEYLVVRVYDDTFSGSLPPIGTERVVRGTDRSFYIPESGLEVVPADGRYVRPAWRLEEASGLHLRVVAPFVATDEDQVPAGAYLAGQDVFLTGREGFFFPTEALEVVGAVEPVPLGEGEAIYVRELNRGTVRLVQGPVSFLVDPTREELARRDVGPTDAALWGVDPRADRAPSVDVPPSTAIMVQSHARRQVILGPVSYTLAYDEEPAVLRLSTGRPKSTDRLLATCLLRTEGNKVSDVVRVDTADHVSLELLLSYRVSFTGEPTRWFNVEDYVGLLCDHMASIIRAAARGVSVERFHAEGTRMLRDAVLGARGEDAGRAGRRFEENGMWVYDLEVLAVGILDPEVADLLTGAQRMAIVSEVDRKKEELRLGDERLREVVSREIFETRIASYEKRTELEAARRDAAVAEAGTKLAVVELELVQRATHEAEAERVLARARHQAREAQADLDRRALEARAAAFREQMQALSPELIATLRAVGNQRLASELTRNLSPLAILGGESVADVAARLLDRLPVPLGDGDSLADVVALVDSEPAE